jgi:molecular chaperone DnaK
MAVVETARAEARAAIEKQDTDAVSRASERLGQAAMKMGEALYKAQAEEKQSEDGTPGGSGASGPGGNDKVVDAEFEEVDPNKRKPS